MSQSTTKSSSSGIKQKQLHIVYGLQLRQHVDPMTKNITVVASPPEDKLQSLQTITANQQRLHKIYVCDTEGLLAKSITFTESDYREVVKDFFRSDSSDGDESGQTDWSKIDERSYTVVSNKRSY